MGKQAQGSRVTCLGRRANKPPTLSHRGLGFGHRGRDSPALSGRLLQLQPSHSLPAPPHPAALPSVSGQTMLLKNISIDMSGYYICTASNDVGTAFCNITLAVRPRESRWGARGPSSAEPRGSLGPLRGLAGSMGTCPGLPSPGGPQSSAPRVTQ